MIAIKTQINKSATAKISRQRHQF